jgi:hypothetical protein
MTTTNHEVPLTRERCFAKDAIVMASTQQILRCAHLSLPEWRSEFLQLDNQGLGRIL